MEVLIYARFHLTAYPIGQVKADFRQLCIKLSIFIIYTPFPTFHHG